MEIKDVRCFNNPLLVKWTWRLGNDKDGLWVKILKSKYLSWRSLIENKKNKCEFLWWRDIRKLSGFGRGKNGLGSIFCGRLGRVI